MFADIFHPLWGVGYQFWSGIGSDFGELTLLTAMVVAFRRVNCHVKGCPRIGKYHVDNTPYKVCALHHPRVPTKGASAEHIADLHGIKHLYATGQIEVDELEKRLDAHVRQGEGNGGG